VLLGLPAALAAQVGYPPERSPFTDLEYRQHVSVIGGYFSAKADRAGVAPGGGAIVGVQYDLGFGAPVFVTTRVRSVVSERTVIDPIRPAERRVLGTTARPLTIADAGLTLALTGQRSFHGLVPLVHAGVGVASTFGGGADPGGFNFGTSFALAYGLGVRYVPERTRWALRADLGNTIYRVRYPQSYTTPSLDGTSVLPRNASLSSWLTNTAITAGVSYQFRR
jgi:hypothetical protein